MSKQLYIRHPKLPEKERGPFEIHKLRELVENGELRKSHEVSVDRKKWVSSKKVKPSLFEGNSTKKKAEAKIDPEKDLTAFEDYSLSGGCDKPWVIAPFSLVAAIISYLGMGIGLGIGTALSVLSLKLTEKVLEDPIEHSDTVNLVVGAIGALFGYLFSMILAEKLFNRCSKNRSTRIRCIFAIMVAVIVASPFVYFSMRNLLSQSPDGDSIELMPLAFAALVIGVSLVLVRMNSDMETTPFCETCHSFLNLTHVKTFPISGRKIDEFAKAGDVESLESLEAGADPQKRYYATVKLLTCEQNCLGHLIIDHKSSTEGESGTISKGHLNARRTNIWIKLLIPFPKNFLSTIVDWLR